MKETEYPTINKISRKEQAKNVFHRPPERYNCAQSILSAFKEDFDGSKLSVEKFRSFGAGRAPEGCCGTLYAGLQLLESYPQLQRELYDRFFVHTGQISCRAIRKEGVHSCRELVGFTAQVLQEFLESWENEECSLNPLSTYQK